MSEPSNPNAAPTGDQVSRPRRSGWLTALMIIVGIVLLLPGVCALVFAGLMGGGGGGLLALLWLICLAISVGGIALIAKAIR